MAQTLFSELVNEWHWMVPCDGTSAHLGTGKHHGWAHWGYTDVMWCHNQDVFISQDVQSSVRSPSLEIKIAWMRLRPWLCCWSCLSKELNLADFPSKINLWLYSDYNSSFCWLCPKAPGFVLDLRFCVCDLVPPGIRVTGVLLLTPAPGMPAGHPSVVGCYPGQSYSCLLHQVKHPMPVLGSIFLRPCHLRFCTHLIPVVI